MSPHSFYAQLAKDYGPLDFTRSDTPTYRVPILRRNADGAAKYPGVLNFLIPEEDFTPDEIDRMSFLMDEGSKPVSPVRVRMIQAEVNATFAELLLLGVVLGGEWDTVPSSMRDYATYRVLTKHHILGLCELNWKFDIYVTRAYRTWYRDTFPKLRAERDILAAARSAARLNAPSSLSVISPARSGEDLSRRSSTSTNSKDRARASDGADPDAKRRKTGNKSRESVVPKPPKGYSMETDGIWVSIGHFRSPVSLHSR